MRRDGRKEKETKVTGERARIKFPKHAEITRARARANYRCIRNAIRVKSRKHRIPSRAVDKQKYEKFRKGRLKITIILHWCEHFSRISPRRDFHLRIQIRSRLNLPISRRRARSIGIWTASGITRCCRSCRSKRESGGEFSFRRSAFRADSPSACTRS